MRQIRIKLSGMCLAHLRLDLAKQLDLLDKNEYKFPVGNRVPAAGVERGSRIVIVAMHHPFTMPMEEDLR